MSINDNFNDALEFTLAREGDFVDHPADRGGRTNKGITQKALDSFMVDMSRMAIDVKDITPDVISQFYKICYWSRAKCFLLPKGLSIVHFDSAVNHGPGRAIKFLQSVLNLKTDGIIGPITKGAIKEKAWREGVVSMYLDARTDYYYKIIANDPTQKVFKAGWMNRLDLLEAHVCLK